MTRRSAIRISSASMSSAQSRSQTSAKARLRASCSSRRAGGTMYVSDRPAQARSTTARWPSVDATGPSAGFVEKAPSTTMKRSTYALTLRMLSAISAASFQAT